RACGSRVAAHSRCRLERGRAAVRLEDTRFKQTMGAVFGTRNEREWRRIQPLVDAINQQYARLHGVSEDELRGQTDKFRRIIRERVGELEAKVTELKEQKRSASDPAERDRIDRELGGPD